MTEFFMCKSEINFKHFSEPDINQGNTKWYLSSVFSHLEGSDRLRKHRRKHMVRLIYVIH